MFAARYWAPRFWGPRYWANTGYALVSDVAVFIWGANTVITSQDFREEGGISYSLEPPSRGSGTIEYYAASTNSSQPAVGVPIYIRRGDASGVVTQEFAGIVNRVHTKPIGDRGDRWITLTIVSLESCLDEIRIRIPRGFINSLAGSIVRDIMGAEGLHTPIALGTISDGVRVTRVYTDERVSDIFTDLATACGFVCFVDHATAALQFHLPDTTAAPFTLSGADTLWESPELDQTRQDFRTTQITQLAPGAAPISSNLRAGDSSSVNFTVDFPVDSIVRAAITTSVRATQTGTFTGQPTDGDTISLSFVTPTGTAVRLQVSAPSSVTGAVNFSVTVTALDSTGSVVTGYAGTVHFVTSDGTWNTTPADSTLTSGVGTFTFQLQVSSTDGALITASDTVDLAIVGVSARIFTTPVP